MGFSIRPSQDDVSGGICTGCGCACGGKVVDEGIGSYEYWGFRGSDHDYVVVSDCCEEPIAEDGGVVVDERVVHLARKDHYNPRTGKVIVHAGRRYVRRYVRTWWRDDDGNHGAVLITKRELAA